MPDQVKKLIIISTGKFFNRSILHDYRHITHTV